MLRSVFAEFGHPPKVTKSFDAARLRAFLGCFVNYAHFLLDRSVIISPLWRSRKQAADAIEEAIDKGSFARGSVSKAYGKCNWVSTNCFGRVGRTGTSVLRDLLRSGSHTLTDNQVQAHQWHLVVLREAPPRSVFIRHYRRAPVVLYSDASFEPGLHSLPRAGWVMLKPGVTPVGMTALIRQQLLSQWCERKTQIIPSEAVCAVGASWHLRGHMRHRDVLYSWTLSLRSRP